MENPKDFLAAFTKAGPSLSKWYRTCQECFYEKEYPNIPSDTQIASSSYEYAKCPICKSEAFDYGTQRMINESEDVE